MLRLENISKALQTLMELLYFHPQLSGLRNKNRGWNMTELKSYQEQNLFKCKIVSLSHRI